MTPKDELLARAAQEYHAFRAAIDGLGEDRLTEAWLGEWSIRDIAAHIAGWQRELRPALERLARGERPILAGVRYDDVDAWNAKFATERGPAAVRDVLRELEGTHEAFLRAAAGVPDGRFQPGRTAYTMVDLNSAHHYKEHGDQIRAWRALRGI